MLPSKSLIGIGVVGALTVVAVAQPAPPTSDPPAESASPAPADPPADSASGVVATQPATASLQGRILDNNGAPIAGAVIMVGDGTAISDADGKYTIATVSAGWQTLGIEAVGYATRKDRIEIAPGKLFDVTTRMDTTEIPGEEIVVIGTRLPEKRLDAPVTIEIVSEKDLKTAAGASYLSALSRVKGIDFSDAGIGDQRISARGFATQFNSRIITMVDGRLATLPGSGIPQGNLLPASGLDMKAVEVVVGPASAMYGPNAHTGVVNIVTKTPWDDSGAAISLRGGTQSMFAGAARIAGTVADKAGYKLNGEFLRAQDFAPSRRTHSYTSAMLYEGDLVYGDYKTQSLKTDGTLYYKHRDWLASAGAGISDSTGFTLTNAGRNHLRGWQVQYQTVQLSGPHVYAQVTRTASAAGKSYQLDRLAGAVALMGGIPSDRAAMESLRDSLAFVDDSSLIDSELQLRHTIAGVRTTLGGQYKYYAPSSAGTYLDDRDRSIRVSEAGAYLQLDTLLADRLRLAGAIRADRHSLYATQISPKAAIQYEVADSHQVRVSYNRAFKSPTMLENYLFINDVLIGNRTGFVIKDGMGATVAEIDALEPEQVDAFEAGYKAAIAHNVYLDAVAYQSWYRNFISALTPVANPASGTFAEYPDGRPVGGGSMTQGALQTYMNFGRAKIRGVDVGVDYRPIDELTLSASGSAINLVSFENTNALQSDLLLNAPLYKLRGSVQADDLGIKNSFWRVDGRFHTAYEFASGRWDSRVLLGGKVPARTCFDMTVGYKLPKQGITISGTIANMFDNRDPDVLGSPNPRRYAWLQLVYDFDGLRY
ncbi:MAG: TonB-dependent receptor [Kofleriaceae bacterium]